jgi:uncharacterized membrane protein YcaP (DUF421 family)
MLFDTWNDLWRIGATGALAYAAIVLILRMTGKRTLAKFNIFDFAVTVAFGSTLATILLNPDVTVAEGAFAFAVLAGLQWFAAILSMRMKWFEKLVRSSPRLLLRDGQFLRDAMRQERVTRGEVEAAIRGKGIGSCSDVAAVVLETSGDLSVIGRHQASDRSALQSVEGFEQGPG